MYIYENEEQGRGQNQSHYDFWLAKKADAEKYTPLNLGDKIYFETRLRAAKEQDEIEKREKKEEPQVVENITENESCGFDDARINKYAQRLVGAAAVCFEWLKRPGDDDDDYLTRADFLAEQIRWITDVRNMLLRCKKDSEK